MEEWRNLVSQTTANLSGYLQTVEKLSAEIVGLSNVQLRWKAAADQWSVTEVLTHLADHHLVVSFRIREILSGSSTQLPVFAQDPWVAGQYGNEGRAEDALQLFGALLHYNHLIYARLRPEDWQKTGVNFRGEKLNLVQIIDAFISHVELHLAQIRSIKEEYAAIALPSPTI